jgi:hypothetical protein
VRLYVRHVRAMRQINIMKKHLYCLSALLCATAWFSCGLQLKPLPSTAQTAAASAKASLPANLVFRFFDEDFVSGGYAYWYPDQSKVFIPEESGKNGEVALEFDLVANDYSGGSVCLYNLLYDLTPYYSRGALQFWIKGAVGGEVA